MKQELEKIEKEVLDTTNENYFYNYLTQARQLISDIQYFEEHINRARISKRFSLEVFPSYRGTIMDWFVKELFFNNTNWRFNVDEIILRLKIYDITYTIFNKINHQDEKGWSIDEEWVRKGVEWSPILKYYTDKTMIDVIYNFNGGNYSCEKIREVFNKFDSIIIK